jgi:hypothetical protein
MRATQAQNSRCKPGPVENSITANDFDCRGHIPVPGEKPRRRSAGPHTHLPLLTLTRGIGIAVTPQIDNFADFNDIQFGALGERMDIGQRVFDGPGFGLASEFGVVLKNLLGPPIFISDDNPLSNKALRRRPSAF